VIALCGRTSANLDCQYLRVKMFACLVSWMTPCLHYLAPIQSFAGSQQFLTGQFLLRVSMWYNKWNGLNFYISVQLSPFMFFSTVTMSRQLMGNQRADIRYFVWSSVEQVPNWYWHMLYWFSTLHPQFPVNCSDIRLFMSAVYLIVIRDVCMKVNTKHFKYEVLNNQHSAAGKWIQVLYR